LERQPPKALSVLIKSEPKLLILVLTRFLHANRRCYIVPTQPAGATVSSGAALGPFSLSGVPLEGTQVVRLVYIDEAGISNKDQEPFLTVAGIVVQADSKLNAIENHLGRLVERHIPARHRDGFIFHAKEIFNGGGPVFKRVKDEFIGPREWPLERRLKIADDLAACIQKFDLPIAFGWIERESFAQDYDLPPEMSPAEQTIAAHVSAFLNCVMMAEHWMRKNATNENCLLIVEDNSQARSTIRDVYNHHKDKKLVEILDEQTLRHFPLRKVKEDPLFQPKKPSNPLNLADFCAYVWKKILMKDKRYERFFDPMRKHLIVFEEGWLERPRGKRARNSNHSRQRQAPERPA
jgi:hypothetical protein